MSLIKLVSPYIFDSNLSFGTYYTYLEKLSFFEKLDFYLNRVSTQVFEYVAFNTLSPTVALC